MGEQLRPDIEAARSKMRIKVGAGREIKRLHEHLWEQEQVRAMTAGTYGPGTGLVVLTDRRLLFVKDGVMSKATEDFPLDKISSVQWSSGIATGTIAIFASGNKAEIKNVNKDDGKSLTDLLRVVMTGQTATGTYGEEVPTGGSSPQDIFEQLRKLGELRDAGIVTPEEFEKKKAELLSRI
ncbi:PH domain-containing protein [Micromonospora sp. CPCC 205371]|nr:PH domain-containing protein [Micromonospora sp. CPCC 205371]